MRNLLRPSTEELVEVFTDITEPLYGVDVGISSNGTVLWVNVDGVCVLRICRAKIKMPGLKPRKRRSQDVS